MDQRLTRVSKYLSKYLRHAPDELGLSLRPGGWVPVDDLLAAAGEHGFPISYDEPVEVVETNDKRRFAFYGTGDLVRANQGHGVEVDARNGRSVTGPSGSPASPRAFLTAEGPRAGVP